jgi:hypothetical protein
MASVGKRVVDFVYVHLCALGQIPPDQQRAVEDALRQVPADHPCYPNVAKLNVRNGAVSLLDVPFR